MKFIFSRCEEFIQWKHLNKWNNKNLHNSCVFFSRHIFFVSAKLWCFFESSTIARGASFFFSNICRQKMAEKKWPYSKLYTFFFWVVCVSNIFLLFRGLAATLGCKYNKNADSQGMCFIVIWNLEISLFPTVGETRMWEKKDKKNQKDLFQVCWLCCDERILVEGC